MQIDQNKFVNLLIEKSAAKINQLSNQVLVLETQLQLAADANKYLQEELDKLKKKKEKITTQTDDFSQPS